MKKALSLIFLTVSLTMIWVDCSSFSYSDLNPVSCCNECPDSFGHLETSHSHGQEDHLMICDTRPKTNLCFLQHTICGTARKDLRNIYYCSIWQPPKFS